MRSYKIKLTHLESVDVVEADSVVVEADRVGYNDGDLVFWINHYPVLIMAKGTYVYCKDQGEVIEQQ